MYYSKQLDDFLGLAELGAAKTSCPSNKVLVGGKCVVPTSKAAQAAAQAGTVTISTCNSPNQLINGVCYTKAQAKKISAASDAVAAQAERDRMACPPTMYFNTVSGGCEDAAAACRQANTVAAGSACGTSAATSTSGSMPLTCDPGYEPNKAGKKCVKSKVVKQKASDCAITEHLVKGVCTTKTCPKNKELDTSTGKCVKAGTSTSTLTSSGLCPDGSYPDPTTGICGAQPAATNPCAAWPGTVFNSATNQCMPSTGTIGGCAPGFTQCPDGTCIVTGSVCPTTQLPTPQCGAGGYYDSNPSSPTYGQCVPSSMLQTSYGGGGGYAGGAAAPADAGATPQSLVDTGAAAPEEEKPSSSKLWLVLGAGVLVAGGLYLWSKKKKGKKK